MAVRQRASRTWPAEPETAARRAVFKGKPVWCDEPMYSTLDEAFAAVDAAIRAYLEAQG